MIGWLGSVTYYIAFIEGWALYAENPLIAEDTDTYKYEPMQKYGMLKWQVMIQFTSPACLLFILTLAYYVDLTKGADRSNYKWKFPLS